MNNLFFQKKIIKTKLEEKFQDRFYVEYLEMNQLKIFVRGHSANRTLGTLIVQSGYFLSPVLNNGRVLILVIILFFSQNEIVQTHFCVFRKKRSTNTKVVLFQEKKTQILINKNGKTENNPFTLVRTEKTPFL